MENGIEVSSCSFLGVVKTIVKCIKVAYLICAIAFVCYGLYNTIEKLRHQHISVASGVEVVSKFKFPSVTFCYKYKHGSKNALLTYNNQLFGKWNKSGNILPPLTEFVTTDDNISSLM